MKRLPDFSYGTLAVTSTPAERWGVRGLRRLSIYLSRTRRAGARVYALRAATDHHLSPLGAALGIVREHGGRV
jgi:hypothetical protein